MRMTAPPTSLSSRLLRHMRSILCWAIVQRYQDCIAQVRQEPPDLYAIGCRRRLRAMPCLAMPGLVCSISNTLFGARQRDRAPPLRRCEGQWCVLESERV